VVVQEIETLVVVTIGISTGETDPGLLEEAVVVEAEEERITLIRVAQLACLLEIYLSTFASVMLVIILRGVEGSVKSRLESTERMVRARVMPLWNSKIAEMQRMRMIVSKVTTWMVAD